MRTAVNDSIYESWSHTCTYKEHTCFKLKCLNHKWKMKCNDLILSPWYEANHVTSIKFYIEIKLHVVTSVPLSFLKYPLNSQCYSTSEINTLFKFIHLNSHLEITLSLQLCSYILPFAFALYLSGFSIKKKLPYIYIVSWYILYIRLGSKTVSSVTKMKRCLYKVITKKEKPSLLLLAAQLFESQLSMPSSACYC